MRRWLLFSLDLHYLPAILINGKGIGIGEFHLYVVSIQEELILRLGEQYGCGRSVAGDLQGIALQLYLQQLAIAGVVTCNLRFNKSSIVNSTVQVSDTTAA